MKKQIKVYVLGCDNYLDDGMSEIKKGLSDMKKDLEKGWKIVNSVGGSKFIIYILENNGTPNSN